jgi:hypothetical protein
MLVISKGQRYRARTDIAVCAMTRWALPFSGGYDRVLRAKEELVIAHDPPAGATAVYADAVAYRRLHRELIPRRDRWRPWVYRGFCLCVKLDDILSRCDLMT